MNSIELMEKAAIAITEEIKAKWPSSFPVKVFAGPHNNGGDALAVSRILTLAGYDVEVFLFNVKGSLSPDCQTNRDRLVEQCPNVVFHEIDQKVDLPRLTEQTLVIDGLFGIGLNRPLSSSFIQLVKFINKSPSTVISIDIPSGMMSEDNTSTSQHAIIEADYTFSIHACKPAFLLTDCQQYIGHCKVLDIAKTEFRDEIGANTTDGVLNREIVIKLIRDRRNPDSPYYWYISFIASDNSYWALLVNPETGEVVTKKN